MRSILTFGAAALTLAFASAPALAQTPAPAAESPPSPDMSAPSTGASATPSTGSSATPSAGARSAAGSDASATAAALVVGTTVKDNTGVSIGQITEIKPDASGKQVATIKMGPDTFAVETDKLAVQDGSATINATQAELKTMLKK